MRNGEAPILPVNADDPEAVVYAIQLAADYRMEFRKDVVIDLVCYRRRGHNESEEPMKTQPLMYEKIRSHPTTHSIYSEKLISAAVVSREESDSLVEAYREKLESSGNVALSIVHEPDEGLFVDWRPYLGHDWDAPGDTSYDAAKLQNIAHRMEALPDGFAVHTQVQKIIEDRHKMAAGAMPINWGFAEVMAYASLTEEGYPIRLTGQDVGVGTFSHRQRR